MYKNAMECNNVIGTMQMLRMTYLFICFWKISILITTNISIRLLLTMSSLMTFSFLQMRASLSWW